MTSTPFDKLYSFMEPQIGREIDVGDWLVIDQPRIDRFADVTGDKQWIHVDPVRAAAESPYKATVAHGFLTLSLLPYLSQSNTPEYFAAHYPAMRLRVNMGVNKVRFPAPVIVGSRVRARTELKSVEPVGDGAQIVYQFTVEIDGEQKPACVAESVVRVYP